MDKIATFHTTRVLSEVPCPNCYPEVLKQERVITHMGIHFFWYFVKISKVWDRCEGVIPLQLFHHIELLSNGASELILTLGLSN